jgi:hypothetical protein
VVGRLAGRFTRTLILAALGVSLLGLAIADDVPRGTGPTSVRAADATDPAAMPTPTTALGPVAIVPTPGIAPPTVLAVAPLTLRPGCDVRGDVMPAADRLLGDRVKLGARPVVALPHDPTWREDPFHDHNWLFNYHSLRFVLKLEAAWARTGRRAYLDRALFLLHDWLKDNPRAHPRSPLAWERHATAWRAMVYTCTAEIVPMTGWLRRALLLHGATLADEHFYQHHGNHALNQAIGLLEVGCYLGRSDWLDLAARRINKLVVESVDDQGVTNEQAIGYEFYNYERYQMAALRLQACGRRVSSLFSRIDLMPEFLGWSTLPDRRYEQIGDTDARAAHPIPGTLAEFAASGGTSGPHPVDAFRTYRAGYAFGRSGWGDDRPFADETAFSLHYGPARRFHGHADGSALTVYGFGSRLIVGTGKYSYDGSPFRSYFLGRSAQNVVTVGGVPYRRGSTPLRFRIETAAAYGLSLKVGGYAGVSDTRTVIYSRTGGYLVVDDRLRSARPRTYTQLWHLAADSRPIRTGPTVRTHGPGGQIVIRQLLGRPSVAITTGARSPIQGWRTTAYNQKTKAPAVLARRSGRAAHFLTLIVPVPDATVAVRVISVRSFAGGFSLVVSVGERTERMVVQGASVSVTPLS